MSRLLTGLMLLGLLGLSRWHPENDVWLPDAAFAVFFLLGRFFPTRPSLAFAGALVALGIDLGISHLDGAENYCLTPAYGVLLLSYAWMWQVGRWSLCCNDKTRRGALMLVTGCAGAASVAFLLNNTGFYLWSGHFAELAWYDYLAATWHYGWGYVGATILYVVVGLGCAMIRKENKNHHSLITAVSR